MKQITSLLLKPWVLFTLTFTTVTILTLLVTHGSPLHIQELRLSPVGMAWNIFILPGMYAALFPVFFLFQLIVKFILVADSSFNGCPGLVDGGPCDPYFFTILAMFIGVLYGGVALLIRSAIMVIMRKKRSPMRKK